MVECAGLEIRYTVIPYRGFKSHSFRQKSLFHGLFKASSQILCHFLGIDLSQVHIDRRRRAWSNASTARAFQRFSLLEFLSIGEGKLPLVTF